MPRLIAITLVVTLTCLAGLQNTQPAAAQERKSLLQLLFGGGNAAKKEAEKPARSSRVKKRSTAKAKAPALPIIEKSENARKILVIGDFLADGAADGLTQAFAQSPNIVVIDRANGSSGLVRDDFYNWPKQASTIIDDVQPALVVVQIGSNDRQQLRINGTNQAIGSPDWLAEYERRTQMLANVIRSRKLPLIWIGVPAFKSPSMTTDMAVLNGIYRKVVEQDGGEFIDIWDGFVDENGKFIYTGSDINGQQVRLRGPDGINMTQAGRRKIAFYTEKSIKRILGNAALSGTIGFDSASLPEITMPPALGDNAIAITRTRPISMIDPELDGGTALLSKMPTPASLTESPRDKLVIDGLLPTPPKLRADNFIWPPADR